MAVYWVHISLPLPRSTLSRPLLLLICGLLAPSSYCLIALFLPQLQSCPMPLMLLALCLPAFTGNLASTTGRTLFSILPLSPPLPLLTPSAGKYHKQHLYAKLLPLPPPPEESVPVSPERVRRVGGHRGFSRDTGPCMGPNRTPHIPRSASGTSFALPLLLALQKRMSCLSQTLGGSARSPSAARPPLLLPGPTTHAPFQLLSPPQFL